MRFPPASADLGSAAAEKKRSDDRSPTIGEQAPRRSQPVSASKPPSGSRRHAFLLGSNGFLKLEGSLAIPESWRPQCGHGYSLSVSFASIQSNYSWTGY